MPSVSNLTSQTIGKVYATACDVSKMKPLEGCPYIELMALNVTNDADVVEVIENIIAKEGQIDIVINNAGMTCFGLSMTPTSSLSCVFRIPWFHRPCHAHLAWRRENQCRQESLVTFEPPLDSLYQKYLPNIKRQMWASQAPMALSTEDFAELVTRKALSSNPPFYMTMGYNSGKFAMMMWLPRLWVLDLSHRHEISN
ncbi:hypothetical protein DFH08DRAFT_1054123 [Mycena albidolilacea]|uniref:Uncharacterized protein n=1 Tax=Mycena albidolilacea TaxID=1033008 RepID=A0AAD6Z3S0_9AGAR|nr:hypothetical protein DFH08DRAFT_1054123 [Mycena albidolilacea]